MLSKLVLSQPARMVKAKIYSQKDEIDSVLLAIQASNCTQPATTRELSESELKAIEEKVVQVQRSFDNVNEILTFLTTEKQILIEDVDPYTVDSLIDRYGKQAEEVLAQLKTLETDRVNLGTQNTKLIEDIQTLDSIAARYPTLTMQSINYEGALLFSSTVITDHETAEQLEDLATQFRLLLKTVIKDSNSLIFIVYGFSAAKRHLQEFCRKHSVDTLHFPSTDSLVVEYVNDLKKKLESINAHKEQIEKQMQTIIDRNLEEVIVFKELLQTELERLKVLQLASQSHFSLSIEAWIPLDQKNNLLASLNKSVRRYHVDFEDQNDQQPPSRLDNLKLIQPFETITRFYGIPGYNELDPTPLLAYSFTLFFSFMLGDAVYGVILILATRFLLNMLVDDPESPGFQLFKRFLYIVGVGSVIAGILFGSYAGDAPKLFNIEIRPILPSLTNAVDLIVVSMVIGLVHVNVAYLLKLLNFARNKSILGVIGGVAFFVAQIFGIPYVLRAVLRYDVAGFQYFSSHILLYGSVIALAVYVICKTRLEGGFGLFLWIFDLAGLMGDVLSYTRLAGLSLSGVFLGSAFNLLCRMLFHGIYGMLPNVFGLGLGVILSAGVFTIGHLINVALGVIGSFVHSLRLCAVEFLPKFFSANGSEFNPVRFKINKRIAVHAIGT